MRLPEEPEPPFQINIVPAIDVIFAILVYFIVSSLFLARPWEGLPVNLPQAETGEVQRVQRLTVSIDRAGNLALESEPIDLATLRLEILARRYETESDTIVVIVNADAGVDHGTVVAVMDELRKMAGVRLAIATQQPSADDPASNP